MWKDFESAFRKRFIPREHIERAIYKYTKLRQDRRPVLEHIVEKEEMRIASAPISRLR